jgi:hypothetical protein
MMDNLSGVGGHPQWCEQGQHGGPIHSRTVGTLWGGNLHQFRIDLVANGDQSWVMFLGFQSVSQDEKRLAVESPLSAETARQLGEMLIRAADMVA